MTSASPAALIAVRTARKKSIPRVSPQPIGQLRRHEGRRTIASPSHDRGFLAFAVAASNAVPLTEHDHAGAAPPSDDTALDDNPGNGRVIPATGNNALDDHPENRFTQRHPAVSSTSAPVKPAARATGTAPC